MLDWIVRDSIACLLSHEKDKDRLPMLARAAVLKVLTSHEFGYEDARRLRNECLLDFTGRIKRPEERPVWLDLFKVSTVDYIAKLVIIEYGDDRYRQLLSRRLGEAPIEA